MAYTEQELLKLATKNLIVNKEVAKLADTKTMTRRLKTNLKAGDVFWLREPARVLKTDGNFMKVEYLADGFICSTSIPSRFIGDDNRLLKYKSKWLRECQGVPNGCIKEMARHFYEVISVHSERLQDITFEDIFKEGFPKDIKDYFITTRYKEKAITANTPKELEILTWWIKTWNSTAKTPSRWEDNPMVEVVEYEELKYE